MNSIQDYLEAVRAEIEGIKTHATPGEKFYLDKQLFEPSKPDLCIYGLMTGNCWSKRATELIRLVNPKWGYPQLETHEGNALEILDWSNEIRTGMDSRQRFTPLEHFINNHQTSNMQILEYLREERAVLPELVLTKHPL